MPSYDRDKYQSYQSFLDARLEDAQSRNDTEAIKEILARDFDARLNDAQARGDIGAIQDILDEAKELSRRELYPNKPEDEPFPYVTAENWPKDRRFDDKGCLPIIYLIAVSTVTISATLLQSLARSS